MGGRVPQLTATARLVGPPGPTGPTGPQGPQGPQGPPGDVSGKLDKITGVTDSDLAYVKLGDGSQYHRPIHVERVGDSLAMRGEDGTLQARPGTDDWHVATVAQLGEKLDKAAVSQQVSDSAGSVPSGAAVTAALTDLAANLEGLRDVVVAELPQTGEPHVLYLVGTAPPYERWIWIVPAAGDPHWVDLGSDEVDLSGYVPVVAEDAGGRFEVGASGSRWQVARFESDGTGGADEKASFRLEGSGFEIEAMDDDGDVRLVATMGHGVAGHAASQAGMGSFMVRPGECSMEASNLDGASASLWLEPGAVHLGAADGTSSETVLNVADGQALLDGHPLALAPTMETATVATDGTMQAGGVWVGTVGMAPRWEVWKIAADAPCRVRLYTSPVLAAADMGRPVSEDPPRGAGCLLEYVLPAAGEDVIGRVVAGVVADGGPDVAVSIQTVEAVANPITVDLYWIGVPS